MSLQYMFPLFLQAFACSSVRYRTDCLLRAKVPNALFCNLLRHHNSNSRRSSARYCGTVRFLIRPSIFPMEKHRHQDYVSSQLYLFEIKVVRRVTSFGGNELATVLIDVVCIALLVRVTLMTAEVIKKLISK